MLKAYLEFCVLPDEIPSLDLARYRYHVMVPRPRQFLGQFFMAIDPNSFCGGFEDRMSALNQQMRTREKAAGETEEILIAGDPEKAHMAKCQREGGIRYHPNLIDSMNDLAVKMNVEPMKQS